MNREPPWGLGLMSRMCREPWPYPSIPTVKGEELLSSCSCNLASSRPLGLGDFKDSSSVHCTSVSLTVKSVWGGQEVWDSLVGSALHLRRNNNFVCYVSPPGVPWTPPSSPLSLSRQAWGRWLHEADCVSSWCYGRATTLTWPLECIMARPCG